MHDEAAVRDRARRSNAGPSRTCRRARCAPAPRAPMRVMMRMLATTYGESVISTPQRDSGESIGPMQYGTTYIVRPRMQPSNSASICAWPSAGAIQWLFGPASSRSLVQTKVRCSTRATSSGCERCSQLRGCVSGLSGSSVPSASICAVSAANSLSLPSHQWIAVGLGQARDFQHPLVQRVQAAAHACPPRRRPARMASGVRTVTRSRACPAWFLVDGHASSDVHRVLCGRASWCGISVAITCST